SPRPHEAREEAADHVMSQVNGAAEWAAQAGMPLGPHVRDRAHLRELGMFNVGDVDTCIKMIRDSAAEVPLTHFCSWPLPPGLPAKWIQPHLELFASKVIPAFQ